MREHFWVANANLKEVYYLFAIGYTSNLLVEIIFQKLKSFQNIKYIYNTVLNGEYFCPDKLVFGVRSRQLNESGK